MPAPKMDFSREEAAEREIGRTSISPAVRRFLVAIFVVSICCVPLIQCLIEGVGGKPLRVLEVLKTFPNAIRAFKANGDLFQKVGAANSSLMNDFKVFEKSLEDESFLMRYALPSVQYVTLKFLGLGNEKVYPGRDGWLFYRPDVDYVSGAPFLSPNELRHRANALVEPNPLPALIRFHQDLAARGIRLILLPLPVKPMLEAEALTASVGRYPLQNASFAKFLDEVNRHGIEYVDPTEFLAAEKTTNELPQFLKTDSHWTPSAMERVANLVADKVGRSLSTAPLYKKSAPRDVQNHGDLIAMLRLSNPKSLFPIETATIHPIVDRFGNSWHPDPSAEVLLLGDSFTNIYSSQDLGWGTSAGLAEHLSFALQKPLDRIAVNAGGSSTARQSLVRSPERLHGKRVVIYEFAMRDLSSGDWKILPLPQAESVAKKANPQIASVSGVIQEISRAPKPGSVPYRDLIICIHLNGIKDFPVSEVLVFLHGMKNNALTSANQLKAGDTIQLEVVPWSAVEDQYGSINRKELSGPAANIEEIFWSESVPEVVR